MDVADFSASGGADGGVATNNGQCWPQQMRRSRPVTHHIILPKGIERTVSGFEHPYRFSWAVFPPLLNHHHPIVCLVAVAIWVWLGNHSSFGLETHCHPLGGKLLFTCFYRSCKAKESKKTKIGKKKLSERRVYTEYVCIMSKSNLPSGSEKS